MIREYTPADRAAILANRGSVALIECTPEYLDESVKQSLFTWAVEGPRGLSAVCGVIANSMWSEQCLAWVVCTNRCDARLMKRELAALLERFPRVHIVVNGAWPKAVRFADWLGFQRTVELERGYVHYELRRQ